ncbi:hypothetical protein KEM56_006721 [Ascosphaera pollenicola]|nr:hypothetical protein KEM56_006721 [Ascosphaera pollenicola]
MQEHIRRAHPNHYIPKLPATEESFQRMVNTPPDKRLQQISTISQSKPKRDVLGHPAPTAVAATQGKTLDDQPALANAAEALAQLHHTCPPHRSEWDSEPDSEMDLLKERMHSSLELPPLRDQLSQEAVISPFQSQTGSPNQQEPLPSILGRSPPRIHAHSLSHPFLQSHAYNHGQAHSRNYSHQTHSGQLPMLRRDHRDYHRERDDAHRVTRPRKGSLGVTQSIRRPKHDRYRVREHSHTISGHRPSLSSIDRKALSLEPSLSDALAGQDHQSSIGNYRNHETPNAAWVQGKRWEDLIEAATSATEADERLTERDSERDRGQTTYPVLKSPRSSLFYEKRPPNVFHPNPHYRASLPHPQGRSMNQVHLPQPHPQLKHRRQFSLTHTASTLQRGQAAVAPSETDLEPFPSVDAHVGPRHGFSSDTVPLSLTHNLLPQHSFKSATGAGPFSSIPGAGSSGPRGLSSMSVTSDPENFSLNNHSTSHAAPFGAATPSGRNVFGRTSSISANASACASPVTAQRPLTAYSSFSASPAFNPSSGAIHTSTGARVPGLHRASNPIPYATALSYAGASRGSNAAVVDSPQDGPSVNLIGSPSTEIGSTAMANMSLGAPAISTPPPVDRHSRERANTSSSLHINESGMNTRPGTSATPNMTSNLQNMSISRVNDANEDDEDRVMRDADGELRIFCPSMSLLRTCPGSSGCMKFKFQISGVAVWLRDADF